MKHSNRSIVLILIVAALLLAACAAKATPGAVEPVHIEPIAGESDLSRVVLIDSAVKRLDLQTTSVVEEEVVRIRRVGGEVVAAGTSAETWVRVSLTESVLNEVDPSQAVRVLALPGQDQTAGLTARPAKAPPGVGSGSATGELYYIVDDAEHGLLPGQVVFVELAHLGGGLKKIIPYASVIYDLHGQTWTYTNPEPLVYIRHSITIDYIEGDLAVLSEGPPVDTKVVMVGVAELFGAESGVGGGGH